MINTQQLKNAASAAKTKEEQLLCRNLANSISDGSPYTWKMFYSGEASRLLSKNSYKALESVMQTAETMFNTPPCKSPKPRPPTRVFVQTTKGKGLKISEPSTREKNASLMPNPKTRPPIVCALRSLGSTESSAPRRKGKGEQTNPKIEIDDDSDDDQCLPWEEVYHDMFCEDDDGNLRLFKVYEDTEVYYDDSDPEIPLSPCREGDELDPDQHSFLLLCKGTRRKP